MFSVFSNLLHAKNRLSVFVVVVIVCLCFCLFFALMDSIQNGKDSIHQGKVTEGNRDNRYVNNNNNTIKDNTNRKKTYHHFFGDRGALK